MISYYAFQGAIRYYASLPRTIEVIKVGAMMGRPGDLQGTLETKRIDSSTWKEPPHLVLANLSVREAGKGGFQFPETLPQAGESHAVDWFIKKYGPLRGRRTYLGFKDGAARFYESIEHFKSFQTLLLRAWIGESSAVAEIEARVEAVPAKTLLSIKATRLNVLVTDLERFMCILFSRDHAMDLTRICANPECPAPYF